MNGEHITIAGAGLVGSLLGTMLAKRGYAVEIFERRPDMRTAQISAGRSINLAMSDRGLRALEIAGLADDIRKIAIPMRGRMIHHENGTTVFQPYGVGDQAINSVSRGDLNKELMTLAEKHGVKIHFNARCVDVDLNTATSTFEDVNSGERRVSNADVLFGADGAFSAVRNRMQPTDRFSYSISYLDASYKELVIPPAEDGGFRLDKNALHIWPRHSYMMIALPNIDGSFTCTLFLAHKGSPSFEELQSEQDVQRFFEKNFPDAVPHMPTLIEDFFTNPESSLATVRCSPWVMNDRIALIGDAAHAVVPFYGQGMNCGFEDCRVLIDCLDDAKGAWGPALKLYEQFRKPDANAIADLAIENFIEMRDKVADERFLRRKKIEAFLAQKYPNKFIPLYTLVTFSDHVPYSEAQRIGCEQDVLMEELMSYDDVYNDWTSSAAEAIIEDVMAQRAEIVFRPLSPKDASY